MIAKNITTIVTIFNLKLCSLSLLGVCLFTNFINKEEENYGHQYRGRTIIETTNNERKIQKETKHT